MTVASPRFATGAAAAAFPFSSIGTVRRPATPEILISQAGRSVSERARQEARRQPRGATTLAKRAYCPIDWRLFIFIFIFIFYFLFLIFILLCTAIELRMPPGVGG